MLSLAPASSTYTRTLALSYTHAVSCSSVRKSPVMTSLVISCFSRSTLSAIKRAFRQNAIPVEQDLLVSVLHSAPERGAPMWLASIQYSRTLDLHTYIHTCNNGSLVYSLGFLPCIMTGATIDPKTVCHHAKILTSLSTVCVCRALCCRQRAPCCCQRAGEQGNGL